MNTYILGNGNFAQELFESTFITKNKYNFSGFITLNGDKAFVISEQGVQLFDNPKEAAFVIGTQNPYWRNKFISHFKLFYKVNKVHFPNIYNEKAHISKTAIIGVGNVFTPFSCVSGIAQIGDFNSFSNYSSVYNKSKIGNNNIFSPYVGIMNKCCVGDNNIFHPNSVVTENITIGSDNIVSAGECVFDNVNNEELFQSGIILKKPNKGI